MTPQGFARCGTRISAASTSPSSSRWRTKPRHSTIKPRPRPKPPPTAAKARAKKCSSLMTKAKAPESLTLPPNFTSQQIATTGAITPIAGPLFHEYLLAFEITSVLLLASLVGAVVLAKRQL